MVGKRAGGKEKTQKTRPVGDLNEACFGAGERLDEKGVGGERITARLQEG